EQARGERVDERADVYALGAILYELLAGRPAYGGEPNEVVAAVQAAGPPPVRALRPEVPEDLASVVDKAMAREKAGRYPTAKLFAEDLERFQTGKLVGSHAYSRRQLVRRFLAKNRAAVAVAAVGAVALLALVAAGIGGIVAEKRAVER